MNYYDILEVSPRASGAVIKAAYKSLIQRYHPDRNQDDPAIAEKAALIVQAYKVLSDDVLRAAYDRERSVQTEALRFSRERHDIARSATQRTESKGKARFYWLVGAALLLVVSGWLLTSMRHRTNAEDRPVISTSDLRTLSMVSNHDAVPMSGNKAPSVVRNYLVDLSVPLQGSFIRSDEKRHVLRVPVVEIHVGRVDSDSVIRQLRSMKPTITQALYDRLMSLSYQELISRDGEIYLSGVIVDSISDTLGMKRGESVDLVSSDRYGVVGVSLPRSYSVD